MESDPPKLLEFTFKISPYATIEELKAALDKFKKNTEHAFKKIKKYSYAASQSVYQYDAHGRIDYFSIPGSGKPFSQWQRLIDSFDLKRQKYSNARIGQEINLLYGGIQDRSLLHAVSEDLKEACRLIQCAKYESFPNNPPLKEDLATSIHPPKLRPPKYVIEAFQRKVAEPATQKAIKEFFPRAIPYKPNKN